MCAPLGCSKRNGQSKIPGGKPLQSLIQLAGFREKGSDLARTEPDRWLSRTCKLTPGPGKQVASNLNENETSPICTLLPQPPIPNFGWRPHEKRCGCHKLSGPPQTQERGFPSGNPPRIYIYIHIYINVCLYIYVYVCIIHVQTTPMMQLLFTEMTFY